MVAEVLNANAINWYTVHLDIPSSQAAETVAALTDYSKAHAHLYGFALAGAHKQLHRAIDGRSDVVRT